MRIDYFCIGKRVRMLRNEQNLSQEKLAELVGISTPHMSNIENGKTKFSLQVLVDLTEVLNTTPGILLFGGRRGPFSETMLRELEKLTEEGILKQAMTLEESAKTIKKILRSLER